MTPQQQHQALLIHQFYLYCLQVLFARDIVIFLFFTRNSATSAGTESLAKKSDTWEENEDSSEGDIEKLWVKIGGAIGNFFGSAARFIFGGQQSYGTSSSGQPILGGVTPAPPVLVELLVG